jgi:hypothetical protein
MPEPPNPLELLGKRGRYLGKVGVVVGRFDPQSPRQDHLAPLRDRLVTIRFEGLFGPTFVEAEGAALAEIEVLGDAMP